MDKSREEFEDYFEDSYGWGTGDYPDQTYVTEVWNMWQASRKALVADIDWPEANDDYWKGGEEGAYARGHEDGKDKTALAVRKWLNSAGITVKGDE